MSKYFQPYFFTLCIFLHIFFTFCRILSTFFTLYIVLHPLCRFYLFPTTYFALCIILHMNFCYIKIEIVREANISLRASLFKDECICTLVFASQKISSFRQRTSPLEPACLGLKTHTYALYQR